MLNGHSPPIDQHTFAPQTKLREASLKALIFSQVSEMFCSEFSSPVFTMTIKLTFYFYYFYDFLAEMKIEIQNSRAKCSCCFILYCDTMALYTMQGFYQLYDICNIINFSGSNKEIASKFPTFVNSARGAKFLKTKCMNKQLREVFKKK